MEMQDALRLARERGFDLVEVGPNAQPAIAKLMDYGKYVYQKERQERESRSKTKHKEQELKTVRVGFKTGAHDRDFKAKKVQEFLNDGHQVKIELTLRGREKALAQLGRKKLEEFLAQLTEPHQMLDQIKRSPFGWIIVIRKANP